MNCLIIDDDPVSRKHINNLCGKVDYLTIVEEFSNPTEALQLLNNRDDIDLIFLDIHMPEINGIDFFKSTENPPAVIFTTGDQSKAVEAFEVNAADYLVKPITFPRFLKAIERVKPKKYSQSGDQTSISETDIFINDEGRLTRIPFNDIAVIEAKGDYVLIKLDEQKRYITRSSMKKIENKLPPESFMRVHRSYIVNLKKIVDIEEFSILINQEVIPISRNAKSDLLKKLNFL